MFVGVQLFIYCIIIINNIVLAGGGYDMIYTVTFNPSLDYLVTVKNLQIGKINRTNTESVFPWW
jgi:hypothetical protein